jgi:hypothetical protein
VKSIRQSPERRDFRAEGYQFVRGTRGNHEALAVEADEQRERARSDALRPLVGAHARELAERSLEIRNLSHYTASQAIR